MNLKLCVEQDD